MERGVASCILLAALLAASQPFAQEHRHAASGARAAEARTWVRLSDEMREHMLANMRDHLAAVHEIQGALAAGEYDRAAELAERRLGMSSLELHGAHELAPSMPQAMRGIGTEMHRAASRFALDAASAGASGNVQAPLASLAKVTAQCVACHASFRIR